MRKYDSIEMTGPARGSLDLSVDPTLDCRSGFIRLALDYWRNLCGPRSMPAAGDLDVLDIPRAVLPYVGLLDVEYEPVQRFRWRLIGTAVTTVLERDLTGCYWDEVYDETVLVPWLRVVNGVLEDRAPVRFTSQAHVVGKEIYDAEHIYLPMSQDGDRVDRIFKASVFTGTPAADV